MATSIVSIWNMALGWIGTKGVTSLTENSPERRACEQFYDIARQQTLRDHPWNFAQTRVALAEVDVPDTYPEYAYAYAWPDKCIRAHKVRNDAGEHDFEVVLAADGASRMILTNTQNAVLLYTADVKDPALFDPLYVRALARRLAADMGKVFFKNNPQTMQELETYYSNEVRKAQAMDAREGKPEVEEEIPWIMARTMPEG
jgi:hypothetical protein